MYNVDIDDAGVFNKVWLGKFSDAEEMEGKPPSQQPLRHGKKIELRPRMSVLNC